MSAIGGRVTAFAADGFTLELSALSGVASAQLASRALGSTADDWTSHGSVMTAVGQTRSVTGLTEGAAREWRLRGPSGEDGQHGIVTPSSSVWETLLATVETILSGQGATPYRGTSLPPNPDVTSALVRPMPERRARAATNVAEVEYPVGVEIEHAETSDTGAHRLPEVASLQRALIAALDRRGAADFPGIAGLIEIAVDVQTKDQTPVGVDTYDERIRARSVVRFLVWESR